MMRKKRVSKKKILIISVCCLCLVIIAFDLRLRFRAQAPQEVFESFVLEPMPHSVVIVNVLEDTSRWNPLYDPAAEFEITASSTDLQWIISKLKLSKQEYKPHMSVSYQPSWSDPNRLGADFEYYTGLVDDGRGLCHVYLFVDKAMGRAIIWVACL